ncbi:hypothetical protein MLD38_035701 [Melastoma candidum]|uniref:Uncharacterized protein n=1 Tax=Melastoma candidum TaxID=119954 RepID=A0ACB9LHF2_9MYRT|nr:hypothetical protein MLD38_035701 [Melastoma candidum]
MRRKLDKDIDVVGHTRDAGSDKKKSPLLSAIHQSLGTKMGKRSSRSQGKEKSVGSRKRRARDEDEGAAAEDMDDEIDAFHKKREVVPLNIHGDAGESDDDDGEEPVFDFQEEEDEENEEDGESEDDDDDTHFTGLAAKIARQQKYLREKMGGVEDEMHDDEEDDEENRVVWSKAKGLYYANDEPMSSDNDLPDEEEAEVLRLQKEKAKSFSMEDFGLDEVETYERDSEPTLEEIKAGRKGTSEVGESSAIIEVEKDLSALTKEEQMDVVYSSAPELVGLLSELNEAVEELEKKINPLLVLLKEREQTTDSGFRYLEVKQILLMAYCQAITFYLLLKSEGQPVRDHPVIARLVEIKSLLDKMRKLDESLPLKLEEILKRKSQEAINIQSVKKTPLPSDDEDQDSESSMQHTQQEDNHEVSKKLESKVVGTEGDKLMRQSQQNRKMLEFRAALEEKLRNKIFSSTASKRKDKQKLLKPVNGLFETLEDFDDYSNEAVTNGLSNGHTLPTATVKIPSYLPAEKRQKIVSGDDDLPKRDDVGERRRKHELRVLAGAGMNSEDDIADDNDIDKEDTTDEQGAGMDASESGEPDDDFYEQVKQLREAKLAAKAEKYSRPMPVPSLPETVDGKRHITYQMEKNRGLTRKRNKDGKNPRSKYRKKHQKKMVARKGQVREIRKPAGPYGGESTGINANISRSIRFKS